MKDWLPDQYVLRARFMPAAVVLLPAIGVAFAYVPSFQTAVDAIGKSVAGLMIFLVFVSVISGIARRSGKSIEEKLFLCWGGVPTTQLLRHRDGHLDRITKARFHTILAEATGLSFPNPDEENEAPERADEIYASAVNWLRENIPETARAGRIKDENINYGFARNLFGMKRYSISISVLSIVFPIYQIFLENYNILSIGTKSIALLFFSLVYLFCVVWLLKASWVRDTAFDYARALVSTIDQLD